MAQHASDRLGRVPTVSSNIRLYCATFMEANSFHGNGADVPALED